MIPILFEGTETEFTTNGLGRLADAISCRAVEEENATYELEMTYPITGVHYEDIQEGRIILAKPFDGGETQPFIIYMITKPLNGIVTVNAEHISYRLSGITVMPFSANSCVSALEGIKTNSAVENPFEFVTDKSVAANFAVNVPTNARELLCGSQGSILDVYGKGTYEFNRFNVSLKVNRGTDNHVTLRYGKNITDLKSVLDITNVYTGITPYWTDGGATVMTLPEKVVMSNYASMYPYKIIKPVDFSERWDEKPSEAQLRAAAEAYVANNEGWKVRNNITVSFVALWDTEEYKDIAPLERVKMGDAVRVYYKKLGVDFTTKVIRTDYNVLQERYNEITLGDTYYTLSQVFTEEIAASQEEQTSHMQKAIAHATALITGGLGGYVVFTLNADGQPEEITIMDKPDVAQAVRCIRMNKNGIGFSDNGYNGPFTTAWTIEQGQGHFVADYIDVGKLNADLIKTGTIMDYAGKNSWDMLTGDFLLSASTKVGTSASNSGIATQGDVTSLSTRITANANGLSAEITRASNAEGSLSTRIQANADGLTTKVSKNGVISSINQSSESVTINANKVNLSGYVTVSSLGSGGSTVIDGSRIQTGVITGHSGDFSINFNDGTVTMKKGTFTGTITGSTIQSAASGVRMVMQNDVTLRGMDGSTTYNFIDMMQGRNNTTQMTIGANDHLNIMTPVIALATSKSASSVKTTVQNTNIDTLRNVRKIVMTEGAPYNPIDPSTGENTLKIKEGNVPIYNNNMQLVDAAYCQLPVFLLIEKDTRPVMHGMLLDGSSYTPSVN